MLLSLGFSSTRIFLYYNLDVALNITCCLALDFSIISPTQNRASSGPHLASCPFPKPAVILKKQVSFGHLGPFTLKFSMKSPVGLIPSVAFCLVLTVECLPQHIFQKAIKYPRFLAQITVRLLVT